jgi:hypothetical protein
LPFGERSLAHLEARSRHLTQQRRTPALLFLQARRRHSHQTEQAQPRQALARDLSGPPPRSNQGTEGRQVVGGAHPRHEEQRLHIALLEEVLDLGPLQQRVDGHQHQPHFGGGHHEDRPFRDIGRPDGDVIALGQPEGQQPFGHCIRAVAVVLVGPADGERIAEFGITGIDNRFLGSKLIGAAV